jgi:hypothetical protein
MAKRLRDVCGLPESEPLWRAGRGFVVRPWFVGDEVTRLIILIPNSEFETSLLTSAPTKWGNVRRPLENSRD